MPDTDQNALVAQILSSYLSNNTVAAIDLSGVIESVKRAFTGTTSTPAIASVDEVTQTWEPAVSVKKSVTPEAVICLCCGRGFKALKRHLATEHQLDPSQYRAAFNLKADYPIVAPNYAAKRSELAKSLGLGRKPKAVEEDAPKKRAPKAATKTTRAAADLKP